MFSLKMPLTIRHKDSALKKQQSEISRNTFSYRTPSLVLLFRFCKSNTVNSILFIYYYNYYYYYYYHYYYYYYYTIIIIIIIIIIIYVTFIYSITELLQISSLFTYYQYFYSLKKFSFFQRNVSFISEHCLQFIF